MTGTNAGITMARAAPACTRTVKASHSSRARGSIDSRSLDEYENERVACTFNMHECTSAAIDPM